MSENIKNQKNRSKKPEITPFFHGISESSWKSLMNLKTKLNNGNNEWFFEN